MLAAFAAAGWTLADSITLRSSLKIAGSVAFHRPDPSAPVSPLLYRRTRRGHRLSSARRAFRLPSATTFAFGASATSCIRIARSGSARPAMTASVGLSHFTLQVTHRIGADLDAEREFVGQSLGKAGAIRSFFQISGVGPTLRGKNGGGDRYFTDGEILIGVLARDGRTDARASRSSRRAIRPRSTFAAPSSMRWERNIEDVMHLSRGATMPRPTIRDAGDAP